jgi:SAM-dependent methyltransferase
MMNSPACRICNGPSQPVFAAGSYRMYRCEACRTAFVSPAPTSAELADFYAVFHRRLDEGGGYEMFEDRMSADFPAKIRLVRSFLPKGGGGRLMDVGCGKGFFVKSCSDVGIDARGVDLSSSAIDYAVNTLNVRAHCGLLDDLKGSLGRFDAVTFWATIEHLRDPVQTLRDIHSILEPGGRLFLDTGTGDDFLDRCLPGHVQWFDPPQHLFVFSEHGMRHALRSAGFEIVSMDTNFERSKTPRVIRTIRNNACAVALRIVSSAAGLKSGPFAFTRFQLGNVMSVVAERQ